MKVFYCRLIDKAIIWLSLATFSMLILFSAELEAEPAQSKKITLDERATLAATYMGNIQRKTGYFSYEFDFIAGRWSSADELVRQAGASYGLSDYLLTHPDPIAAQVIQKAIVAYRKNSIQYNGGKLLTSGGDLKNAETGATALALMGALQFAKATGDRQFEADIVDWKNGLLALHRPSAGFVGGPADQEESPYFNGEAWLALAVYSEYYPADESLKKLLPAMDAYMVKLYSTSPDIGFFHWGLMAASKRFKQTKATYLADFVAGQVSDFLVRMRPDFDEEVNSCYSVEGMSSALSVLQKNPQNAALSSRLLSRVRQEMAKNIAMQILPDQTSILLTKGRTLIAPEVAKYSGAFINGMDRPQIRIDFTQHCLSALIKSSPYLN